MNAYKNNVDWLNYWAILLLESLNHHHPTQAQIDLVALLLHDHLNDYRIHLWFSFDRD